MDIEFFLRFAANAAAAAAVGSLLIVGAGRTAAALAACACVMLAGFCAAVVTDLGGLAALPAFLAGTWTGEILGLRLGLLALAAVAALRWRWPALGAAVAAQALAPWSGHAAATEPVAIALTLHGLHAGAASLWAGGVAMLFISRGAREAIARFSRQAPWFAGFAAASGLASGWMQAGGVPALLGTPYGQLMLAKSLLLLLALAAAARLRFGYLAQSAGSPRTALAIETAVLAGIVAAASALPQTIPARHADIIWPLPWRFVPEIAMATRDQALDTWIWVAFAGVGTLLAAVLFAMSRKRWPEALIVLLPSAAAGAMALSAGSVPATPTTYTYSPVPFAATSVSKGAALFAQHCKVCHGKAGHGDGPSLTLMPNANADLTQPHTRDHTMGDLFWQVGHGSRNELMPGFADVIPEEGRWDLINFVRALAQGHESVRLGERIQPGEPWLASIDFGLLGGDGRYRSLWEPEGHASTLLVIARDPQSRERLAELNTAAAELKAAGIRIIAVIPRGAGLDPSDYPGFDIVSDGAAEIIAAWENYRRVQENPDPDNTFPYTNHIEFLIDRFGYVRARMRGDFGWLYAPAIIAEDGRRLTAEPQLLPPPSEHIH